LTPWVLAQAELAVPRCTKALHYRAAAYRGTGRGKASAGGLLAGWQCTPMLCRLCTMSLQHLLVVGGLGR
jgi:hypothetical protein